VCVSVCLSASISPEPHARSLPNFARMSPVTVARSSSGGVTQFQEGGTILGVFFPTENAVYGPYCGMNFATKDRFGLNLLLAIKSDRIQGKGVEEEGQRAT